MSTTVMDLRFGRWVRHSGGHRLLLALVTAAILTALAPLHTADMSWLSRALEFTAAALIWEVAMVTARKVLSCWPAVTARTSPGLILVVATASVPATATIALVLAALGQRTGPLPTFYAGSLLLGLLVAFARRGLRFGPGAMVSTTARQVEPEQVASQPGVDFLRNRAPKLAGGRLLALEAEDHYLRVHSDRGSELILLRMRDAVDELGTEAGWKPHRSFWLSADAGGQAVRRGQAWQIVLDGGLTVPVSKTAIQEMRSAGYRTS